eukprot:753644-Hanusia_phi.AAC.7
MSRLTRKIPKRKLDPVEQEMKDANFSEYIGLGAKLGGTVDIGEGEWDELRAGAHAASLVQTHLLGGGDKLEQGLDTFQELTHVVGRIEDGVTARQVQAAADVFKVKIQVFEVTPFGVKIHRYEHASAASLAAVLTPCASFLPLEDPPSAPGVLLCCIAQHFWCITPFDFAAAEAKSNEIQRCCGVMPISDRATH